MSHLLPCPGCNRHVDATETACPFCGALLPESFRAARPLVPPRRRLGRAALMTAGAALMGAAACSANDTIGGGQKDASHDAPVPVPFYGAPVAGTGGNVGAGGSLVAAYGGAITGMGGRTGAGGAEATGGTSGATDAGGDGATDAAGGTTGRDASSDRALIAIYGAPVAADKQSSS